MPALCFQFRSVFRQCALLRDIPVVGHFPNSHCDSQLVRSYALFEYDFFRIPCFPTPPHSDTLESREARANFMAAIKIAYVNHYYPKKRRKGRGVDFTHEWISLFNVSRGGHSRERLFARDPYPPMIFVANVSWTFRGWDMPVPRSGSWTDRCPRTVSGYPSRASRERRKEPKRPGERGGR